MFTMSSTPRDSATVFVYGDFNILHPGHIRFLRFAREQGDRLVVGILSNAISSSAELPDEVRLDAIISLECVSEAMVIYDSIENAIRGIRPDFIVKGKEHEGAKTADVATAKELGIKVIFSSGSVGHSESELSIRRQVVDQPIDIEKLRDFTNRMKISRTRLLEIIPELENLKVCVVGDLIVDEYISCEALGMSQEDPTIVVTPTESSQFLGGAGIVSAHAAALGAEVNFFAVTGKDAAGQFAHRRLDEYRVKFLCPEDPGRPTTVKQRYRCEGKTVFRVSHLRTDSISIEIQSAIVRYLMRFCSDADVLIFSDFNYGVVTDGFVRACLDLNWKPGCVKVADSQTSSQIGDVTKFRNLSAIYATEHEARVSLRDKDSGLVVLANQLLRATNSESLYLKLGADGALILSPKISRSARPEMIPAVGRKAVDTAGAGDSFMAGSALAMAAGANSIESSVIGSIAAAIQVSRVGNRPIASADITNVINQL